MVLYENSKMARVRRAKRRRGGPSYEEVKKQIDAKESRKAGERLKSEAVNTEKSEGMMDSLFRKIKDIDAAVQNRIRDAYGLNVKGPIPKWKEATLGFVHPKLEETSREGFIMTRGIQAAGLTAAGYGLMKLTEQFGGAADQQEPGQLDL